AKVTAEHARNTLEQFYRAQPNEAFIATWLSQAYAVLGEKESALNVGQRAIILARDAKNSISGPVFEQNLAFVQTIFGENRRAISTLARLLRPPHAVPITSALLRLDPICD